MPLRSTPFTPACVTFIKQWQGLSLEKYQDKKGIWVIGHGHEITANETFATPITAMQAETLLLADMRICEAFIHKEMPQIKDRFQLEAGYSAWGLPDFALKKSGRWLFHSQKHSDCEICATKWRRLTSLPPGYGFLPPGADTAIQDGLLPFRC